MQEFDRLYVLQACGAITAASGDGTGSPVMVCVDQHRGKVYQRCSLPHYLAELRTDLPTVLDRSRFSSFREAGAGSTGEFPR